MKLSKVYVSKSSSAIDYATEEYIADYLTALKARSNLPIDQILTMVCDNRVDSASCSRDDTNYSFFVSQSRQGIAITVKKLGEDTIEFNVPCKTISQIISRGRGGAPMISRDDEVKDLRERIDSVLSQLKCDPHGFHDITSIIKTLEGKEGKP